MSPSDETWTCEALKEKLRQDFAEFLDAAFDRKATDIEFRLTSDTQPNQMHFFGYSWKLPTCN